MVYNLAISLAYFALFLQFSVVASPLAGLHPTAAVFALRARAPDQSAHIKHHIGHVTSDNLLGAAEAEAAHHTRVTRVTRGQARRARGGVAGGGRGDLNTTCMICSYLQLLTYLPMEKRGQVCRGRWQQPG